MFVLIKKIKISMNFGLPISKIYKQSYLGQIMIKRGNKKGVSGVVVTILFIALALGAVLIVWGLVRTQLAESGSQIAITKACLDIQLEALSCKYDIATNATDVRYKRGTGESGLELVKVLLIFELIDGNSQSLELSADNEVPKILETRSRLAIPLEGVPDKFSIAGVLEKEDGKETVCGEAPLKQICSPL